MHSWISQLQQSYKQFDTHYDHYIHAFTKKTQQNIACYKNCCACCLDAVIPIAPLEALGIAYYIRNHLSGPLFKTILRQVIHKEKVTHCPFLINQSCSVHPMRSITCRSFFVCNAPCDYNEKVLQTRPGDILPPHKAILYQAAEPLMPYYGIHDPAKQKAAFDSGYYRAFFKDIATYDWLPWIQQ